MVMATFEYTALTSTDRLMKGAVEAGSRQEAEQLLRDMQLNVNSIEPSRESKPKTSIGRTEFMLFNQQLASISKTGIPLERALRELSKDIASKRMRKLVGAIADDLEAGVDIVDAFERHQRTFPALYGRILKAGIETGRLSEMLTSLNRNLEVANQTRRIVFEATAYPAVVLALGSIIITAVFIIIIPQFVPVLGDMVEGRLNPITSAFLGMSRHVVSFWLSIGAIISGLVVVLLLLSTFAGGRRFKEWLFMKLPVFGGLYHSSILSKMAESMAILVAAGAEMPTVLRLGSQASGSERLFHEGELLATGVESGANVMEAGQVCVSIPRLFLYSMQLGNQRNELQDNLYSLGQMYAEQTRCSQGRLQAVLLPVMLIVVGSFIALAVLALFLPLIQVVTGLGAG
jgi:type II secretory pathway component PulF